MPNNVLDVSFQRFGPGRDLRKVTVRQKFGNHTLAFADYKFTDRVDYTLPPENTPVQVRWGVAPLGVRTFYGYVNHYETVRTDEVYTRVVLLGTSRVMNAATPTTWANTTHSSMARDIAKRYRLRSVVHEHGWVRDNWASGPRSDFRTLKALADEIGYHLWVDGATLYFLDPKKILNSASSLTVPVVSDQSIEALQVLGGSNIPGEMDVTKRKVVYGLDYTTNEFFQATSGDTQYPTEIVSSHVNTFAEAEQVTAAAARREDAYFTAKARIAGDASLRPGGLVGFESGRVNRDQSGIWTVQEAVHEITSTDFYTDIVAVRGANERPLGTVPTTVRGATEQTAAVVRDGSTWEAALQEHVNA